RHTQEQTFLMSSATPFSIQPSAFSLSLKYFTQTPILCQIGHRRLAKLLNAFASDLKASNLLLPQPGPQNGDYFPDLANALSLTECLPASLRKALFTLEQAASP